MVDRNNAVAITGMGIISAVGTGILAFEEALYEGKSCFISSKSYPQLSFPLISAEINHFNFNDEMKKYCADQDLQKKLIKLSRQQPYALQLSLIAALEAWQSANMHHHLNKIDMNRVGVVIGSQNASGHYQYNLFEQFKENPEYLTPSYALNFMDSNYIGVMSEVFNIKGEGFTVGGASATGNMAMIRAYQLIKHGYQDAVLVVGVPADLSPLELQGFYNLGALGSKHYVKEPNKACRPFDKNHDGFIYGQAAASLLLESASSAKKRKVPILGHVLGGAVLLDSNHLSNPEEQGELAVMQKALEDADIRVNDIDYINAHGTSAPLGDETEISAIEKLLGDRSLNVYVNSTKSITGHCLWSAGIVEAIATVIQVRKGFLHANLNLENPISQKTQFVKEKAQKIQAHIALSNGFGFGGINTCIVLTI